MMDGMMGMGWMMLVWGLAGLAVLALVVAGVIWLVQSSQDRGRPALDAADEDAAERELRRRYAAGEIDQEEYTRRLDTLRRY
ncbi:SHOCT domain-containing protein [Haloechinothrix halophila]|uniref:SHOCT domain-containing protein n=1 Tax=Haloechinothrix halophila TaxID=1069073 RepID=UPI00040C63FC|nr:SHOCT domain-containing protein [Haloechinothrix halophila]